MTDAGDSASFTSVRGRRCDCPSFEINGAASLGVLHTSHWAPALMQLRLARRKTSSHTQSDNRRPKVAVVRFSMVWLCPVCSLPSDSSFACNHTVLFLFLFFSRCSRLQTWSSFFRAGIRLALGVPVHIRNETGLKGAPHFVRSGSSVVPLHLPSSSCPPHACSRGSSCLSFRCAFRCP